MKYRHTSYDSLAALSWRDAMSGEVEFNDATALALMSAKMILSRSHIITGEYAT